MDQRQAPFDPLVAVLEQPIVDESARGSKTAGERIEPPALGTYVIAECEKCPCGQDRAEPACLAAGVHISRTLALRELATRLASTNRKTWSIGLHVARER